MTIELPQDFIDQLNNALDGEGIRLPFVAPIIWWKHGAKQFKPVSDIRYFGGWASNAEDFYSAVGEFGSMPHGFTDATFDGRDGEYSVYQSRSVAIAPIATRKRWVNSRSHTQMLCMMATKEGGNFVRWGPCVLSAKGLTTRAIETQMRKFDSFTADIRKSVAPGVPSLYFWRAIGTFGNEPNYETVGSGNASSSVTYPVVYEPKAIPENSIKKWFVGNDTAGEMVSLRQQVADWLNDKQWKTGNIQPEEQQVDPYLPNGFISDNELPF